MTTPMGCRENLDTKSISGSRKSRKKTEIGDIPSEILFNILSWLPFTHLLQAATYTCKLWHSIITNPEFLEFQFENYSINNPGHLYALKDDPNNLYFADYKNTKTSMRNRLTLGIVRHKDLASSCRGLLSYRHPNGKSIYICNPITNEHIKLPILGDAHRLLKAGFGYAPLTKKYKYLQIIFQQVPKCVIHTLGEESWRELPADCSSYMNTIRMESAVYYNGALYWQNQGRVVSFDVELEKFRTRRALTFSRDRCHTYLTVLEKNVSCVNCSRTGLQQVLVLINEDEDIWVQKYSVSIPIPAGCLWYEFKLRGVWMNEQMYGLSFLPKLIQARKRIFLYNSHQGTYESLELPFETSAEKGGSAVTQVITHVGSLISPSRLVQGLTKNVRG